MEQEMQPMNIHHLKPAYVNVAYCIDTPTYHKPEANEIGFMSEEDRTAFFADCKRVFQNGGWEIEHDYAVNGKSRLYLHPQQFSIAIEGELDGRVLRGKAYTSRKGCGMSVGLGLYADFGNVFPDSFGMTVRISWSGRTGL